MCIFQQSLIFCSLRVFGRSLDLCTNSIVNLGASLSGIGTERDVSQTWNGAAASKLNVNDILTRRQALDMKPSVVVVGEDDLLFYYVLVCSDKSYLTRYIFWP